MEITMLAYIEDVQKYTTKKGEFGATISISHKTSDNRTKRMEIRTNNPTVATDAEFLLGTEATIDGVLEQKSFDGKAYLALQIVKVA